MGRQASGDDASLGKPDEEPLHEVTLSAYEIARFEITNDFFFHLPSTCLSSPHATVSLILPWRSPARLEADVHRDARAVGSDQRAHGHIVIAVDPASAVMPVADHV